VANAKFPLKLILADGDGTVLNTWIIGDGGEDDPCEADGSIHPFSAGVLGNEVAMEVKKARAA
jgi:hypothetical protein